jgi:hypothetical protein
VLRQTGGEIDCCGGLADTAFLIRNAKDFSHRFF